MKSSAYLHLTVLSLLMALAGCAAPRLGNEVTTQIDEVLQKSAAERVARRSPAALDAMDKALMPSLTAAAARTAAATAVGEVEARFDLSVVNAPAAQVFMALVSGTRYSMLMPPDLSGAITINLKDVTVMEALETLRELYGYEFKLQGKRIFIEPNTLKSRVFQINYLSSQRQGSSTLRVSGSSIASSGSGAGAGNSATAASTTSSSTQPIPGAGTPTASSSGNDTSRVSMTSQNDFWGDLNRALTSIIGNVEGRSVVVNPSSGVVMVRAMPLELRNVENYLRATQLIAERQVMLEAKIIDVTLSEDFQSGVNWSAFNSVERGYTAVGVVQPGVSLTAGAAATAQTLGSGISATPGKFGALSTATVGKGFIGLALQTANFAALLSFLETQGNVSVLSSPRIATLNNQKAVLKVGTDELFVTNLSLGVPSTSTTTGTAPSLTLQPYFSGISLDVTPQIDDEGSIILHVHPAVSTVVEKEKIIDLGAQGTFRLPLATSSINETDSIVRVQDGNIVAIGGLMRQEQSSDRSQLPGASGAFASILGQRNSGMRKRELVILIKPTMIQNDRTWVQDIKDTQQRLQNTPPIFPPPAPSSVAPAPAENAAGGMPAG